MNIVSRRDEAEADWSALQATRDPPRRAGCSASSRRQPREPRPARVVLRALRGSPHDRAADRHGRRLAGARGAVRSRVRRGRRGADGRARLRRMYHLELRKLPHSASPLQPERAAAARARRAVDAGRVGRGRRPQVERQRDEADRPRGTRSSRCRTGDEPRMAQRAAQEPGRDRAGPGAAARGAGAGAVAAAAGQGAAAGDAGLLADSLALELLGLLDTGPAPLPRVWRIARSDWVSCRRRRRWCSRSRRSARSSAGAWRSWWGRVRRSASARRRRRCATRRRGVGRATRGLRSPAASECVGAADPTARGEHGRARLRTAGDQGHLPALIFGRNRPPRGRRSGARLHLCRGGRSSVGRAPGCGPGGRGFESHRSP